VKSADSLDAVSTYLFRLEGLDWLGPYARAKLNTQLFPGYLEGAEPFAANHQDRSGQWDCHPENAQCKLERWRRHELTDRLEPLILMETAGLFANPVERKAVTVKAKAGAGAQHVFVGDGYVVDDNDSTADAVELTQLEDSTQAGAELELEATGEVSETVKWRGKASLFLPLVTTSDEEDQTGMEALNTDLAGGLSVKLAKWASLDYTLSVKKVPAVSEDWQVQNNLLLTASFNLL